MFCSLINLCGFMGRALFPALVGVFCLMSPISLFGGQIFQSNVYLQEMTEECYTPELTSDFCPTFGNLCTSPAVGFFHRLVM